MNVVHVAAGPALLLALVGALLGIGLAPWTAALTLRLARPGDQRPATGARIATTAVVAAAALSAAPLLTGWRPALLALAVLAAAAVVLGGVDLAAHRIPDVVTYPAVLACAIALVADGAVTGSWTAVGRGVAAAAVTGGIAFGAALLAPSGLGLGDVKLLVLLGLVLGWAGWGVLLSGLFLGLLAGALLAAALVLARRATWRSPVAFGPPLLIGAALALVLAAPLPVP